MKKGDRRLAETTPIDDADYRRAAIAIVTRHAPAQVREAAIALRLVAHPKAFTPKPIGDVFKLSPSLRSALA
jgi:hypothetical protein